MTKAATAPKQKKSGRPPQAERDAAFDKVVEWLESNDDMKNARLPCGYKL